jgi:hypothetical protein
MGRQQFHSELQRLSLFTNGKMEDREVPGGKSMRNLREIVCEDGRWIELAQIVSSGGLW